MHPSVLAEAYNRPYIPYLLGQKGAASLTQYYGIQQIKGQIKNKKLSMLFLRNGLFAREPTKVLFKTISATIKPFDFCKIKQGQPTIGMLLVDC